MASHSVADLRLILASRSDVYAAVDQVLPSSERLDFLESLRRASSSPGSKTQTLADEIQQLLVQLDSVHQLGQSPLIAVSGLLNAGKSSLIASFLSPGNRKRVLVGTSNQQGTHRFVIWLPATWQQQTMVWQRWLQQLKQIFGQAPEFLSRDPQIAYAQYNGQSFPEFSTENISHADSLKENALSAEARSTEVRSAGVRSAGALRETISSGNQSLVTAPSDVSTLSIPLLATDAALDTLGVGLIECPDIQTGIFGGNASTPWDESDLPEYRRRLLSSAAKLCSAFIVVTKLRDLHDRQAERLLATLKESMPGLPRILAINLVRRRYAPSEILAEARVTMERFQIDRLYAAYDFRGELERDRLPPIPEEFASIATRGEPLEHPIFFRLDRHLPDDRAPRPSPDDYLLRLGKQLNQSEMVQAWRGTLALQLQQLLLVGRDELVRLSTQQQRSLDEMRHQISNAILSLIAMRDDLGRATDVRLQTSKQILRQINNSLHRTAPWWAWPSLMVDKTVAWTKESVSSAAKSVMPVTAMQQSLKGVKDWFKQSDRTQVMTADRLRKELRQQLPLDSYSDWSDEKWLNVCQSILDRFQNENQTLLPEQQLDAWAKSIWENMPLRKRLTTGLVPVATLFAPLAAVLFIPVDFGGSTVLVFASLKELVAAAGVAGAWAAFSGNPTPAVAEQEAAWQQYGDLVAIAMDTLGVPRPHNDASTPRLKTAASQRKLPTSVLPVKMETDTTQPRLWLVRSEFLKIFDQFNDLPRSLKS